MTDTLRVLIKFKLQQWSRNSERSALELSPRAGWTMPNYRPGTDFAPLGIEGGIARATQNMHKLATLLAERNIRLSVAVYPWPQTLALDSRDSRQVAIWKQFCEIEKCKAFIDLFPLFFAEKEAHADWYRRYYIYGDFHFNAAGQRLIFQGLADRLF
jgi:hypothetical protein